MWHRHEEHTIPLYRVTKLEKESTKNTSRHLELAPVATLTGLQPLGLHALKATIHEKYVLSLQNTPCCFFELMTHSKCLMNKEKKYQCFKLKLFLPFTLLTIRAGAHREVMLYTFWLAPIRPIRLGNASGFFQVGNSPNEKAVADTTSFTAWVVTGSRSVLLP